MNSFPQQLCSVSPMVNDTALSSNSPLIDQNLTGGMLATDAFVRSKAHALMSWKAPWPAICNQ